jgi:2-polyprenyl-6-methoxyphenol hydroxylase-like FAD-dependent oxidoreductase
VRYVRGQVGLVRRSWGAGWALVGDAGHWKDPLSTHGLTDALRDAELLARAVLSAPTPGADQLDALAVYQEVRDRLAVPMMRYSDRVASYDWTLPELPAVLRALSSTMTDELEVIGSFAPAG